MNFYVRIWFLETIISTSSFEMPSNGSWEFFILTKMMVRINGHKPTMNTGEMILYASLLICVLKKPKNKILANLTQQFLQQTINHNLKLKKRRCRTSNLMSNKSALIRAKVDLQLHWMY